VVFATHRAAGLVSIIRGGTIAGLKTGGVSLETINSVNYKQRMGHAKENQLDPLRQMLEHWRRRREKLRTPTAPDSGSAENRCRRHTLEMNA
jgi:hypothetical protein